MMGRLLDAHNELHPENAISPGAAAATRLQLLHARRAAVAAWERQHPEAAAAQPLGKRRRADGRSGIERAVERRAGQESAPSPAERQRVEAAAREAELDRKYAENPMRYDAAREFLRGCHQTPQHGSIACHWDACNPGLESVHGVLTGHPASIQPVALAPCGSLQRPPRSALVFPLQGVATLLSAAGPGRPCDEFELHDCRIPSTMHGSVAAPNRGVYVRGLGVGDGAVVCDHENLEKGSAEWHLHNVQHRQMTPRESREAARLHGGLNTWWKQNPNRRS